jgi:hypothetical protein
MFYGNEAKRGAALCELNLSEEKIGGGYTTVSTDPWVIEDCLLYGNRGGYAIEYELRRRGKEPWQWYPDAAGLTLRRCTIADNAAGGVYYRAGYPKPLIPWAKTEADYKRHLEGPWGYLEKAYAPLVADGNVIAGNEGEGLDFSDGGTPAEATLSGNIIADNAKGDVKGLAEGKGYTSPKVAFVRPETPRLWERSYVLSGKGSGNANVGAPCRLLEYLAGSETEAALSKIRAGLKSNDPAHRAAALEALAEWTRTDVREELLAAAKDATDEQARVAAFAGYARLLLHPARLPSIWHAPPEMPQAKRAALVEEALPLAKTDAERQALRRGQAGMPGCPRYEAPLAGEAPKLDGKLDDAVWRRAEPAKLREAWEGPLQAHRAALAGKEPNVPEAPTEVRIAHDRQYCYFAIRCNAPNQRSGQVVISLDPHGRFSEYYQFRIDAKGTVRSLHAPLWRQDPTWNADVRTATQQGENHWTAEVAIPWSDLKVSPKPGRQVRFQVAHHRAGAHSQFPVTSFPGTRSLGKYPEGDSVTDFYTYGYADLGEAKILDNGCSTGSPWGAPCMDAINTYYGRPDTPVGTLTGKDR